MAAVMFGHLPLAFIGLFYAGLPPEGAWPYVMASAVLHLDADDAPIRFSGCSRFS